MFGFIKRWYYRHLFLKIYFIYLKRNEYPREAYYNAYEDIKAIIKLWKTNNYERIRRRIRKNENDL